MPIRLLQAHKGDVIQALSLREVEEGLERDKNISSLKLTHLIEKKGKKKKEEDEGNTTPKWTFYKEKFSHKALQFRHKKH